MTERVNKYKSKSEEILVQNTLLETNNGKFQKKNKGKNEGGDLDTETSTTEEQAKKQQIKELLSKMPITKSTQCGFWIFKGTFFQRFANQISYVIIAGLVGCIFNTTFSYFNGTLSTMEKRFKIPSRNSGIIYVGYDTSTLLISSVLCYYAGKGHRPRWIGFGLLTIITFCFLMALPHFIYGPGENAMSLTAEFGAKLDANASKMLINEESAKSLCRLKPNAGCVEEEGSFTPQIIFFTAEFIAGIGGSLFDSLGATYMDDNTEKAKAPLMLSICYFLRMLGPALGYIMASLCLRLYIAPQLHPTITNDDPRWLGAWWLGWLIICGLLSVFGIFLSMFPKHLPLALARRIIEKDRRDERQFSYHHKKKLETIEEEQESLNLTENIKQKIAAVDALDSKTLIKDMLSTFKELTKNKIFVYNNCSSIFYCFGYTPYWIFIAKYIEIQYRQSASTSSLVAGVAGFAFSAVGVLSAGFYISRFKPTARKMAAWNILCTFLTVCGMISYAFIGCDVNDDAVVVDLAQSNVTTCNSACDCEYVQYSPVCGENGMTYISPCHAGCKNELTTDEDEKKVYFNCSCISNSKNILNISNSALLISSNGGQAFSGACPIDCFFRFIVFIFILSSLKFLAATAQTTSFLLNVRCVPEKDKTTSIGFGMMLTCLLVFIPGPIFFGWVLDCLCLVWGKTCTSEGNCWLYNSRLMRYVLNFLAASFLAIGSIFDIGVWSLVQNLKIFDDEDAEVDINKAALQKERNFYLQRKRNSF